MMGGVVVNIASGWQKETSRYFLPGKLLKQFSTKILIVDLIWKYVQTGKMKKIVILISQNSFKDYKLKDNNMRL